MLANKKKDSSEEHELFTPSVTKLIKVELS